MCLHVLHASVCALQRCILAIGHQYIKDYKVGICRGEGRQSTVRGLTVNSEAIDDQQSTVRGSMVNSEAINDQQSTVRQLTINTVDC